MDDNHRLVSADVETESRKKYREEEKRIDAREREKKNASVHVGDVTPL